VSDCCSRINKLYYNCDWILS